MSTGREASVLEALRQGVLTSRQLLEATGLSRGILSKILRGLKDRGLVAVSGGELNAALNPPKYYLTPKGERRFQPRHDRPRLGDPIIVNGMKYRIRQITATGLFYLSKTPARLARYSIAWPRGLRFDERAGVWRAPDGIDVHEIKPKGGR